jgi:protein N-terminal glutamine amidohydrolase
LTPSSSNQYFVIFVSSESQCVPMFHQLAQQSSTYPCFWDYHVLALEITKDGEPFILDIDSNLPYPCHLTNYLEHVFPKQNLPQSYRPLFRIVPADSFLFHFSSDRRHMRRDDGTFSAPPPTYNCIYATNEGSFNLDSYRFMKESDASHFEGTIFSSKYGSVFTMDQLKMIDWNDIHSNNTQT